MHDTWAGRKRVVFTSVFGSFNSGSVARSCVVVGDFQSASAVALEKQSGMVRVLESGRAQMAQHVGCGVGRWNWRCGARVQVTDGVTVEIERERERERFGSFIWF